jgi:KEOPS complex subunit Cgi121
LVKEIRTLFGKPVFGDRDQLLSRLHNLEAEHGCTIQAIDADLVVSHKHLVFAAEKALAAFGEGRNVAKNPGLEILRYASGERQIGRALAMGVSPTTRRIALVVVGEKQNGSRAPSFPDADELATVIEPDGLLEIAFDPKAVRETFHITDDEITAVGEGRIPDLVLERVALVDTYR